VTLRRALLRNPGTKLLALGIGIVVWFSLSGERRERISERSYHIPLSIVNIPPRSLVASPLPPTVDVRLRGPFTALRQLDPEKLDTVLDLKDAVPGDRLYRLTPEDVNVPPEIEVVSITPPEIRFLLDVIQERELPVDPAIAGDPAAGTRVTEVRATPSKARVTGPSGTLARVSSLSTVPVSVAGRTGSFSAPAAVVVPGPGLRLKQALVVTVFVRLEPAPPAATPAPTPRKTP
jgi:hypothetical protein